ncbi:hypothetical protein C2G38_2136525 [Gigaspora rosea]|uniref:Uncharacterized protein n=1 Tax=Gigaspora rosea TaxID=44941 RepID=A0A397W9I8_9GLOM|nr:hypothetical protein C2G38_2136525 [Gigaspora rosea]
MLCFAITVVKISQVRLYVKDEINSAVVWAVGNYPIEQETNSMMTISTSTCVSINKIPDSNNCPMRVSVVDVDNLEFAEINDYESEALKDYDTTNEYFDETRDSDMKDEEESSDDSFYTKNMRNKSHGRGRGHGHGRGNSRGRGNKGKEREV